MRPWQSGTKAEDDQLRTLWANGLTTQQIARVLGCTRNSVIGKANRLKLTPRRATIKRAPTIPAIPPARVARAYAKTAKL